MPGIRVISFYRHSVSGQSLHQLALAASVIKNPQGIYRDQLLFNQSVQVIRRRALLQGELKFFKPHKLRQVVPRQCQTHNVTQVFPVMPPPSEPCTFAHHPKLTIIKRNYVGTVVDQPQTTGGYPQVFGVKVAAHNTALPTLLEQAHQVWAMSSLVGFARLKWIN